MRVEGRKLYKKSYKTTKEIHLEMLRNEFETYFTAWMESVLWMIREPTVGFLSEWSFVTSAIRTSYEATWWKLVLFSVYSEIGLGLRKSGVLDNYKVSA